LSRSLPCLLTKYTECERGTEIGQYEWMKQQGRRRGLHVFAPVTTRAAQQGPYTHRGDTQNFSVYYDASLGQNGQSLADAVLANCENDYTSLQNYFGNLTIPGLPFAILIDPGTFGAWHQTCLATALHCAAFDGSNSDLVNMLVVAEEDEVFMAAQSAGWDCGASNGEGLSRVLAAERYPQQLDGFASAAAWLNSNRPDWVNQTDGTDTNFVSIGCATLFINYLVHQLNHPLPNVVQAGGNTLQQTYQRVSGDASNPFPAFGALLASRFPPGTPADLGNDNPFPIQGTPATPPAPSPKPAKHKRPPAPKPKRKR
jgi:hypothetical protein